MAMLKQKDKIYSDCRTPGLKKYPRRNLIMAAWSLFCCGFLLPQRARLLSRVIPALLKGEGQEKAQDCVPCDLGYVWKYPQTILSSAAFDVCEYFFRKSHIYFCLRVGNCYCSNQSQVQAVTCASYMGICAQMSFVLFFVAILQSVF